ncbi:hypothetical protein COLO4_13233 [Corchorus olitorius]|uniref:Uncharacterized protein n=1 Tax=Corchorus olitorius TaxID=93759 RepID=A0A1R3JXJ5_9ROSI|nr:hypothetical protein COLO4_13233 [Corchorus olitorius]
MFCAQAWRIVLRLVGFALESQGLQSKTHVARAVLERMCFQVKDVLDSMHKDAGEMGEKKNDKGASLPPHQM